MKLLPINDFTSVLLLDDGNIHICQISASINPLGRYNNIELDPDEAKMLAAFIANSIK